MLTHERGGRERERSHAGYLPGVWPPCGLSISQESYRCTGTLAYRPSIQQKTKEGCRTHTAARTSHKDLKIERSKKKLHRAAMRGGTPTPWLATALSLISTPAPSLPTVNGIVLASYPHDPTAFTQGLHFEQHSGQLLESTGMYGRSTCRRVKIENGAVTQSEALEPAWFGEGLSVVADGTNTNLVQLLWQEGLCLLRDARSLLLREVLPLPTGMRAGWGLTNDDNGALWASDGSATLFELDGASLEVTRTVTVHLPGGLSGGSGNPFGGGERTGRKLYRINDLQWVNGQIWANIWGEDRIACIDPSCGEVRGFVDLSDLLTPSERRSLGYEEVLNGIAYDPRGGDDGRGCLYVTGKNWPRLFKIAMPSFD